MHDDLFRNLRIGALTAVAVAVLAVGVLAIGSRQQLFSRHTRYWTTFSNVTGLADGAPVKLNGVDVGFVERIELAEDPEQQRIRVRFTVNARYTERLREDTLVWIKSMGLLGDKYLEIRGGTPSSRRILEGGTVPGQDPAEVARLVASGEDVMANLIAISASLRAILHRVETGEGLLGELTRTSAQGRQLADDVATTAALLRAILARAEAGEGVIGQLLVDTGAGRELVADAGAAARSLREVSSTVASDLARDDTVYAALLRDPRGGRLLLDTIAALRDTSEALGAAVEELARGEGTLPRLMQDREYADDFLADLADLMANLRSVSDKVDRGDGAAGAFVNDPQLYEDLEHVVRGVKQSKVTSWFVRNRRAAGEKAAAEEAAETAEAAGR